MYRLLEKLISVDEAVAIEVDPQKKLKQYYKRVLNTKLTKSTWPSDREENQYKFWILTDGTVIPVKYSHDKTVDDASILTGDDDWYDYRGRNFMETGAAAGYFSLDADEMGIDCGKKLTSRQISKLKNMYLDYKVTRLLTDIPGRYVDDYIKSVDHLDYLLTYGSDVDEAVAVEVSSEKEMREYYKGELNGKLKGSTWSSETDWYKFWMFRNGDYIPVDYAHLTTAKKAKQSPAQLESIGMIQGSIKLDQKVLSISGGKPLTSKQIGRLRQFYIEYKFNAVFVSFPTFGGIGSFGKSIDSIGELEYVLEYGKDEVEEGKMYEKLFEQLNEMESKQVEKEEFFLERINKHIKLVQGAAAKIVEAYPEFEKLLKQAEQHDQSKFEEPEVTPYIEITWRHKLENEDGEYDPYNGKGYQTPGKLEKEEENDATIHHITTNSHHPEFYLEDKADANINIDDRDKSDECIDASRMPDVDIAEMVADWQAMSEELQTNTAREWFDKQKDVRWHFSEEQEELIDKLLKVFEGE